MTNNYWNNPFWILSVIKALTFFAFAIIINYYAVRFATLNAGDPIGDVILSYINKIDTRAIDFYGSLFLQYLMSAFAFVMSKYLLFFIYSTSVLIIVRSLFVNMTYLGIPEQGVPTISFFTAGGDLFFSGHTALPFLAALVFWNIKKLRYLFLFFSLFMGIEVLIGHHHYTIDVFSAPFITYGVFKFSQILFKKEYDMINQQ